MLKLLISWQSRYPSLDSTFSKASLLLFNPPQSRLREHVEELSICGKWLILSKLVTNSLRTLKLYQNSLRTLSLYCEKPHSHPYLLVMIGLSFMLMYYHKFYIFCKTNQVKFNIYIKNCKVSQSSKISYIFPTQVKFLKTTYFLVNTYDLLWIKPTI